MLSLVPSHQTIPVENQEELGQRDDFLCKLDEKLRLRNERLMRRLLAWADLLDAAGWCVALKQSGDGTIWLGKLAKQHLQSLGAAPLKWSDITMVASGIPASSLHRKGEGILIWSGDMEVLPRCEPQASLTPREAEVMTWLREGKTGPKLSTAATSLPPRWARNRSENWVRGVRFQENVMGTSQASEVKIQWEMAMDAGTAAMSTRQPLPR